MIVVEHTKHKKCCCSKTTRKYSMKHMKSCCLKTTRRHSLNHNSKYMIHEDRKSIKHCCSWTTYEHEHELDFDHDQKSHHKTWCEYENFEIFSIAERYCNRTTLISSLRVLMKLSACILIMIKNNQTNMI